MDVSDYLPMFLAEGREHLQELNLAVVQIEEQPDDPETVDARGHHGARRGRVGRARMPSADIVGLPTGAVVELDRQADEPIDLYVNGRRFATGRLVVVDGADWAVRIETILA